MSKKGYKQTAEHRLKISLSEKGKKVSDESKAKMSIAQKLAGNKPPSNKGKKFSKEHRQKLSNLHKGNKYNAGRTQSSQSNIKRSFALRGDKGSNWKGGLTRIGLIIRECFKYRQWRCDIFTRDNYTCKECNLKGVYLEAHHIKRFSIIIQEYKIKSIEDALSCEELWNINNGITLCRKCHDKTKTGGHTWQM